MMQIDVTETTRQIQTLIYEQIESKMSAFYELPGHEREKELLSSLQKAAEELLEARELVNDLFRQGTAWRVGSEKEYQYDHMCMGIYESSQDYLIEHGLLNPKECMRK